MDRQLENAIQQREYDDCYRYDYSLSKTWVCGEDDNEDEDDV